MVFAEKTAFLKHTPYISPHRHTSVPTFCHVSHRVLNSIRVSNRRPLRTVPIAAAVGTTNSSNAHSTDLIPNTPTINPLYRFSTQACSEWHLLLPALFFALIAAIFITAEPIIYGKLLGSLARLASLSRPATVKRLVKYVVAIAVVYFIETVCTFFYVALMSKFADSATRRLREQLFQTSFANDVGFFDELGRGKVQQALAEEVRVIRDRFLANLSQDRGFRAVLELVLGMFMCIVMTSREGAPFFGILVPAVSIFVAWLGMRNGRQAAKVEQKEMNISSFFNEKMRGIRTLKIFGAEQMEINALNELMDKAERAANKYSVSKAISETANRLCMYVTILILFVYGGKLVFSGVIAFEQLSAMTGFLWLLIFAIQGLLYSMQDVSMIQESLRSIYAVIDGADSYSALAKSSVPPTPYLPPSFNGEVKFNNVHFHYPSRPDVHVLKGISFTIHPGQTVALTGSSGGGKSTIAAMLSRFYVPTQGSVTLDGIDIQSLSRELYADHISLVDQEPILFQGTIRENIAYGANSDKLSDEAIVQAAKEANAHDFIMQLPEQYETEWGPGSNLSGGQKQRIAIARSLAKSPQVLLLDEATSALDQESERAVQNALDRIMEHRTVLIIAHRLSTIRSADMILFVHKGEITERGTYDELLERPDGSFRALVEASMGNVDGNSGEI